MPLTRPIPPEAWPVVEVLRRDVPRPEPERMKPLVGENMFCLDGRCPMGLHPQSRSTHPIGVYGFPGDVTFEHILAFAVWWDKQTDPVAAVSAVWDWPQGSTGPA